MPEKQIWKAVNIIRETKSTITVVFDTGGIPFIYRPGQFIDLTLIIEGVPVTRSYSLSSSPHEDINPSITVKKVAGGLMSNFILNEAEQIGAWQVTGPYGTFTPTTDTYRSHHVVLFAGGSGITPLYSIARSLTGKSEDLKVTLIYSCHSIDEIIFRSQLGQFKAKWGEKMDIYYAISEADTLTDLSKATWIRGRLDKSKIKDLLEQVVERPHLGVHYFICGPAELMRMQREILEMLQVPDHNIYMERFAPGPADDAVEIPQDTQEVLLHFYEQSNLLEVSAGKTILSAALEDRIALPYSCKAGNCGVCVAKLTSGKVIMTNNYALKQTDINNGLILLCQSYPCTDDVTVEIE